MVRPDTAMPAGPKGGFPAASVSTACASQLDRLIPTTAMNVLHS